MPSTLLSPSEHKLLTRVYNRCLRDTPDIEDCIVAHFLELRRLRSNGDAFLDYLLEDEDLFFYIWQLIGYIIRIILISTAVQMLGQAVILLGRFVAHRVVAR